MRFFSLLDFQHAMLLIFLGLIALILLVVAFGGEVYTRAKEEEKKELKEYPEGLQVQNQRVPLILIFVYVGFAVWAVAYVILIGIRGGPF